MRQNFPLFQTPLDLAHNFWKTLLKEGDLAIDATCGNGKDSLVLASILAPKRGSLICIDIQQAALDTTKHLLQKQLPEFLPSITFYKTCHTNLPECKPKLIIFNLGYLPGSDKTITTTVTSTLEAVKISMNFLTYSGAISIVCYPGHNEGKKEETALLDFLSHLNTEDWSCCHTLFLNRNHSPSLLLVQKKSIEIKSIVV